MKTTPELRNAFRHSLAHAGYIAGRRAECALADARAEVKLRRLIESGIARIIVQDDPTPWDGDIPYSGPLFVVTVEIGDDADSLGGIATSEDDVATFYDPEGLQASGAFGGYADQCTIRGYLRTCAVEVASGMASLDAEIDRLDLLADAPTDPTHCGACGNPLDAERDRGATAEYPFCRDCHHSGAGLACLHAETMQTLRAYGLRPTWWHTGGGCWILAVVRADAPDEWADARGESDADFIPFVCVAGAHRSGGEWHVESGHVDRGETLGAMLFRTNAEWCGELGADSLQVAPADARTIAAFCLRNLPD